MSWNSTTVYLVLLVLVGVLALVAIAVLQTRRRKPERPGNPYVEGLTHLIEGDQTSAFERLQQAVRSGNAPTDAYIRLGTMLRERGDAAKALQIHKGLTIKSDLTRTEKVALFVNIAEDYAALGRPEQAVEFLETAGRRLGLREPSVHRLLARESHRMGGYERAYNYLRELRKANEIGEAELAAYLAEAGTGLLEAGKDREAKKTLQRALKHDSECASAHMTLGNLAEKDGDDGEAIRHWRDAARLSASLAPGALTHLERVCFRRGTFSEMEQNYRTVLAARNDDEVATLALASFLRKQARDDDAVPLLEEFHERHPRSIGTIVLLMSIYSQGDRSRFDDFLQRVEDRFVHRAGDEEQSQEDVAPMPWH
jgi:lipopolysaccharide biosynthesis regulator YciM